jgi:hypothetical protein
MENRIRDGSIHPFLIVILLLSFLQLTPLFGGEQNPAAYLAQQQLSEASAQVSAYMDDTYGSMPLYFVKNQGQSDQNVSFTINGSEKSLYFTPEGFTLAFNSNGSRYVIKLDFLGANHVHPVAVGSSTAQVSFFKGVPEEWHTGLPAFTRIAYRDLWPGIDLTYSGTTSSLKYEFVVKPGADPGLIRLAYRGAVINVDNAGQLLISTPEGDITDRAPVAYQESNGLRSPVNVAYAVGEGAEYGFNLGEYDPALPLVIDPDMLLYCGFIGGSGYSDKGYDIAVDSQGYAYVTGSTNSDPTTFPVTVGPDLTYNGDIDAFIAKVEPDGSGLVYAGYIGGDYWDEGHGVAVDANGNAYVSGFTGSEEDTFPVKVGPDLGFNGGEFDAFIARVKADGTDLDYCGYIGGSEDDAGTGVAVDSTGRAYVSGTTESSHTTFPVAVGPDTTFNGDTDAFIARVKQDGTALEYSGYIGGDSGDEGLDVAIDADNNAYVTGFTYSQAAFFPVTVGPDLTQNGSNDAFVAKVKYDGTSLEYCGYIGGTSFDRGTSIAVSEDGSAFIHGWTASTEASFPVLVGPDLTFNSGLYDAYVAKVDPSGTALIYCGYIGGSSRDDYGYGVAVDKMGSAYVTGYTASTQTTFPVLVGPDLTHNSSLDVYVAKVEVDGSGLVYCGYIGGSSWDQGEGIAVDKKGNAYLTGFTFSTESSFPVVVGPDLTSSGDSVGFVAKIMAYPSYVFLPLVLSNHP